MSEEPGEDVNWILSDGSELPGVEPDHVEALLEDKGIDFEAYGLVVVIDEDDECEQDSTKSFRAIPSAVASILFDCASGTMSFTECASYAGNDGVYRE